MFAIAIFCVQPQAENRIHKTKIQELTLISNLLTLALVTFIAGGKPMLACNASPLISTPKPTERTPEDYQEKIKPNLNGYRKEREN